MTKGVVVGTDHAAEAITGFFTIGDGGTDINPIFRLNKRQVSSCWPRWAFLSICIRKRRQRTLKTIRPSLPDEAALGVTYDNIDDYLEGKKLDEVPRKSSKAGI